MKIVPIARRRRAAAVAGAGKRPYAVLAVSVLLSGCAINEGAVPSRFGNASSPPPGIATADSEAGSGSAARPQLNQPRTMAAAIEAALAYSASAHAANADVELAETNVDVARSGFQPALQGSTGIDSGGDQELRLSLTQTLLDWGATGADVDRARFERSAAELALAAEQERVALEAAQSYIDFKRSERLVDAAQQNLAVYRHISDLATTRIEGGVGDASEVEMAGIHRSEAQAALEDVLGIMRNARSVYASRIGAEPATLAEVPDLAHAIAGVDDIRAAAIEAPATAAVLAQGEAAQSAAVAQRASLLPKLTAEAYVRSDYSFNSPDLGVGIRLATPLYNGLGNLHRVEAAQLTAQSASWSAEEAIRQSVQAVQAFLDRAPTLRNRLTILTEQRDRALALRVLYEDQFRLGQRSLRDLVSIQSDIYRIERTLIEARYAIFDLQYAAAAAVGKLRPALAGTV